jgi:hypothetical protein
MAKSVAEKARVKPGTTIALVNPLKEIVDSLGLPADVTFVTPGHAQLVFLFAESKPQLASQLPKLAARLGAGAAIWVFFRKGSKAAGLAMNRNDVWTVAERANLRPLGLISVDDTWSAFRFRLAG